MGASRPVVNVAKEYVVCDNPRAEAADLADEMVRILVCVRRRLPPAPLTTAGSDERHDWASTTTIVIGTLRPMTTKERRRTVDRAAHG